MPVPRPDSDYPAPRRLLRDVVFDQLFEAIADGTLEFGERLNDDELVKWLGVSRTPVREAIAKLAEFGIVDIEANRFTRVIDPTVADFVDTTTTANEVWALIAKRGVMSMTDEQRGRFDDLAAIRAAKIAHRDTTALAPLFDMVDVLAQAAASPMLTRIETSVGARTRVMFRRVADNGLYPFDMAYRVTDLLRAGVAGRDPDATAAGFLWNDHGIDEYFEDVAKSTVFAATPVTS